MLPKHPDQYSDEELEAWGARYERARNLESAVEDFLRSPQLNYIGSYYLPKDEFISHYVACPKMLFADRVDFTSPDMREWLEANPDPSWQWIPSAYGVRDIPPTEIQRQRGCFELYRNGAVSRWAKAMVREEQNKRHFLLYVSELAKIEEFLQLARGFYKKIQYSGPVHFRIGIENRPKSTLWLPGHHVFREEQQLITHDGNLSIDFTDPGSKLLENPKLILKEIGDKMFQAFGIWEAVCFDQQLNLKDR